MNDIERVSVPLGPNSYDVLVGRGLLAAAGAHIAPLLKRPRTVIVTDDRVDALHGAALRSSLDRAAIASETLVVPAGEASKSMERAARLCERLVDLGIERSDLIVALGGGVVGDLGGFVAALVHRGIGFVQIPTTLLAQVDSSVGGKTGVNIPSGKNLIGAFHQPRLVLADIGALETLVRRDYLAGYAEVVKYGVLGDAALFDWLDGRIEAVRARDPEFLREAVRRSVEAKARIVAADEREAGQRMLLNLGHTFGHALEACAGYDGRVLHGEAVAVGMVLALDLSVRAGLTEGRSLERVRAHLEAVGLPVSPGAFPVAFDVDTLMNAMRRDKKASGGRLTLILVRSIGEAFVSRDTDDAIVTEVWHRHLKAGGPMPAPASAISDQAPLSDRA